MKRRILCVLLALAAMLAPAGVSRADEPITLTVAGDAVPDDILNGFAQEHPDWHIMDLGIYQSSALIHDALSHTDAVDVYFTQTMSSITYENLRDRGYFLELTDPALQEMVDSVYPEIREAVYSNGTLCALPFCLQISPTIAVDMDVWAGLGYSKDALPATWADALRFAAEHWPEISAEHEGTGLFAANYAELLLTLIEHNYEAYRSKHNYEMGYDTPEFQGILELFSELCAMDAISIDGESEGKERFLFWNSYEPSVRYDANENKRNLRLSFQTGEAPWLGAGFSAMAINPNSKHIDAAVELMKYVFENSDAVAKLELCPGENAPVRNENYDAQQEAYAEAMRAFEARIAAASSENERTAIEYARDDYANNMNFFSMEVEYIASPESIQKYREEVEGILTPIYDTGLSMEEYAAINEKRTAYIRGQISTDQYIKELERRFVFSVLEGQ